MNSQKRTWEKLYTTLGVGKTSRYDAKGVIHEKNN